MTQNLSLHFLQTRTEHLEALKVLLDSYREPQYALFIDEQEQVDLSAIIETPWLRRTYRDSASTLKSELTRLLTDRGVYFPDAPEKNYEAFAVEVLSRNNINVIKAKLPRRHGEWFLVDCGSYRVIISPA